MSYPGGYPPYPPHQQGGGQYPQPYQATTPLAYPVYPGSAAPQGPISGYPSNPSPYPSYPQSQSAPYPPAGGQGYPPSQPSQYPPSQPPYPSSQPSPYPSSQPTYPSSQPSSYPSSQPSPYPSSQPSPYPSSQPSSYPSSQPSYPSSQPSPYPSSQSGPYPPPPSGHHAPYPSSQPYGGAANAQPQQAFSKGTPTVRPAQPFDPRSDAEILRKAMKGLGTDEKAIIAVLTKRTNSQRQQIAFQFKTLYGKDLISNLKSELSGDFEDLIVALMTPIHDYQAKELHNAISGMGTNEHTLVELMCSATNQEIHAMREAYQRLYHTHLEQDLAGDTSGSFRRLLVSLCQGRRDENYVVDHHSAVMDAQALLNAGELQLGTDESVFNMVLCTRSYPQLIQIFMEYQRLAGHGIEKAVKGEFSGHIESGLLAIIKSVKDKAAFFAEQLHDSMAGAGTRDRALIRIITLRSEIDLEDIKRAFVHKYGKTLVDFVKEDSHGDMERALLSLIQ